MDYVSRYAPGALGVLRIATALMFLQHGLVKLFGFPPGARPGPQPLLSLLGVAGVIETVAGILLVLGLFTRSAAFVAAGFSAVAYWYAHGTQSFYPIVNQGELAALYCFVFLYLFFAGPGSFSIDGSRSRNGRG
ncbi:MAG: DoxX family protein [Alphaproteobacteria bacterium]|nr:DoxX family protein [Alphaproteobacteria bacterium]